METTIGTSIAIAKQWLNQGELVAIPTETVYGLAANALDEKAVVKIFEAKERPTFNPLIVHVADWKEVVKYAENSSAKLNVLAQHFSPGPITFLLPKKSNIPDLVTAGSNKVAIRIPQHPIALALLQQLAYPLAAPSANVFGYVSPTTAQHVLQGLNGRIPYILDGAFAKVGVESTIVDEENGQIIIRRNGGIAKEEIEAVLGESVVEATSSADHPVAPGQLKSHYATHTPLYLHQLPQNISGKIGYIRYSKPLPHVPMEQQFILSPEGNLNEAAANLFKLFRLADEQGFTAIVAESVPHRSIGRAVNDRLEKAQHIRKD